VGIIFLQKNSLNLFKNKAMGRNSPLGGFKGASVCIIGGGLAGLISAIHLAKHDIKVVLLEKHQYPRHKVCGEYVSNEVLPYLNSLGINVFEHGAKKISKLKLSHQSGKTLEQQLPLGGFGISRFTLDQLLADKALKSNIRIIHDEVLDVEFKNDAFQIIAKEEQIHADFVIGAQGKRSGLDKSLDRQFIQQKTPWIGIKAHYKTKEFNENLVELHNFQGGYCGLSMVENGHINLCYLVHQNAFKSYKSIEKFNEFGLTKNPHLKQFLAQSEPVFEKHLSISQISFQNKPSVKDHILYAGDAAGLIHPLCGNGMAMAIHSAKLVSDEIIKYYNKTHQDRISVENAYQQEWQKHFKKRLLFGKGIQSILLKPNLSSTLINLLSGSSLLLQQLIKQTHGKPIEL
jgi:flavin-dependent dehydrogenase